MRAALKRLHSPDIYDLESYIPLEKENFGFLLQAFIGPKDIEGEESFDIELCTPQWINEKLDKLNIMKGCHLLIVKEYNFTNIRNYINGYVEKCYGENWIDIANQLSAIGRWEFDNYKS